MGRYLLRRLGQSAVTLVLSTMVVFAGVRALPGDPARALAGEQNDPDQIAAIRAKYGLDDPVWVQYWHYLTNSLKGDLGTSVRTGTPVNDLLAQRAAGHHRAVAARPPGRDGDRGARRGRRRHPPRHAGRVARQRVRTGRAVGAELLARADGDPLARRGAAAAAGLRVRAVPRRPARQPPAPGAARDRARHPARRGDHAADPVLDARRPRHRLRPHRPGQGAARAAGSCGCTACATA